MKFDQGAWRIQPGTDVFYPLSVVDVQVEPNALTVTGYHVPIQGRWSYLDGKSLTARFTSPMPGVIRVQLTHFKGRRERFPAFNLDYSLSNGSVATGRNEQYAWLVAGNLSVVVPVEGAWRIEYRRDGLPLTASESKAIGLFTRHGKTYLREQLSLQPGETVYGLGEHFGPLVRNGQTLEMWNDDGGTNSELAYKNVPFYLTSEGCGVLVNHPGS